jgi:hypothetical protein
VHAPDVLHHPHQPHLPPAPRDGDRPPAPKRTFATHWAQRCEASWRRAFLAFAGGIPALFLCMSAAAWIKFDESLAAAIGTTAVLVVSFGTCVFYHRKWTQHILDKDGWTELVRSACAVAGCVLLSLRVRCCTDAWMLSPPPTPAGAHARHASAAAATAVGLARAAARPLDIVRAGLQHHGGC